MKVKVNMLLLKQYPLPYAVICTVILLRQKFLYNIIHGKTFTICQIRYTTERTN